MKAKKKNSLEIYLRLKSESLKSLNNSNLSQDKKNRLANIFAVKQTKIAWENQWKQK